MTFDQIEKALDDGRVEMQRPWGDWVPVRRRGFTRSAKSRCGKPRSVPVFMERQVQADISEHNAKWGYPFVRIVSAKAPAHVTS